MHFEIPNTRANRCSEKAPTHIAASSSLLKQADQGRDDNISFTRGANALPKVSYPIGDRCNPSWHHLGSPLPNGNGKSTYETLSSWCVDANSRNASFIPSHNFLASAFISCHALPGMPTARVRILLFVVPSASHSLSRQASCRRSIGSTADLGSTLLPSPRMDEVRVPMSFVPARMTTRESDGSRIPSRTGRRPTSESMLSSMAVAVHPGRPLHRTIAVVASVSLLPSKMEFSSRSRWGP